MSGYRLGWVLLIVGVVAVPALADFKLHAGSGGLIEVSGPPYQYEWTVSPAGGLFGATLSSPNIGRGISKHHSGPMISVTPDVHGLGGISRSSITFSYNIDGNDYSTTHDRQLHLTVYQDGVRYELLQWGHSVDWYMSNSGTPQERAVSGGGYDPTRPYQVGLTYVTTYGENRDYTDTLSVTSFWVDIAGADGEEDQGGGDPGGPGGPGGGGDPPPNNDPGDNPDDTAPGDGDGPGEPGDDATEPSEKLPCYDELKTMFSSKFPAFSDAVTSGNDFWKIEFDFTPPELFGVTFEQKTFYWSSMPDPSWPVGAALDNARQWVRTISILLMLVAWFRTIVLTLRQW